MTLLIIAFEPWKRLKYGCYGTLIFIGAWGTTSVLVLALQCSPVRWALGPSSDPNPQNCIDQYTMQLAIRAMDIVSDLIVAALPMFLMQTLQTSREKKWTVIMLFSLKIAWVASRYQIALPDMVSSTPILTAISMVSLTDFYNSEPDERPWHAVPPALWTSAALNLSIITTCIPSIKRFLADWAAGLSTTQITEPMELGHSGGKATSPGTTAHGSRLGGMIATKIGLGSNSRSEVTSTLRSRSERRNHGSNHVRSGVGRAQNPSEQDTSDSVKGLTDGVILHTTDYHVEFEDANNVENGKGSFSSGGPVGTMDWK